MERQQELLSRLRNPEDNYTERKPERAGTDDFRRTLIAFANSVPQNQTAVLFIGVSDRGEILGITNPESTQKTVREICEQKCYPRIHVSCTVLTIDEGPKGRHVVAVEIPASIKGPHFAGPAYVRVGAESIKVTEEAYADLFARRCDKVRQLLEWKQQVISVVVRGKKLGSTVPLHDPDYRAVYECKVTECTPHYVRLSLLGYGQMCSEPLENVRISWDDARYRPMLIVQES
jgi:hypothetical protein